MVHFRHNEGVFEFLVKENLMLPQPTLESRYVKAVIDYLKKNVFKADDEGLTLQEVTSLDDYLFGLTEKEGSQFSGPLREHFFWKKMVHLLRGIPKTAYLIKAHLKEYNFSELLNYFDQIMQGK